MVEAFPGKETILDKQIVVRQKIIDAVIELSPEKRVAKLIELGILTDLDDYIWGTVFDRFFVFANIEGVPVPIYKSQSHTSDKRSDLDFFVFFGVRGEWVIKGNRREINNFYGIQALEEISRILTKVFDFDTSEYIPEGKKVADNIELNNLLQKRFKKILSSEEADRDHNGKWDFVNSLENR